MGGVGDDSRTDIAESQDKKPGGEAPGLRKMIME